MQGDLEVLKASALKVDLGDAAGEIRPKDGRQDGQDWLPGTFWVLSQLMWHLESDRNPQSSAEMAAARLCQRHFQRAMELHTPGPVLRRLRSPGCCNRVRRSLEPRPAPWTSKRLARGAASRGAGRAVRRMPSPTTVEPSIL